MKRLERAYILLGLSYLILCEYFGQLDLKIVGFTICVWFCIRSARVVVESMRDVRKVQKRLIQRSSNNDLRNNSNAIIINGGVNTIRKVAKPGIVLGKV